MAYQHVSTLTVAGHKLEPTPPGMANKSLKPTYTISHKHSEEMYKFLWYLCVDFRALAGKQNHVLKQLVNLHNEIIVVTNPHFH